MDYDHQTNYVLRLIEGDAWMMDVLQTVRELGLPDWWIAGGFVRNKVWDTLHKFERRTHWNGMDVDVIYFDPSHSDESLDKELELRLFTTKQGVPWSVKNQARMHILKEEAPYTSSWDAMKRWIEVATCVGVRLNADGKIELAAPYGVADIIDLVLRPNPNCKANPGAFEKRLLTKHWTRKWPQLKVSHYDEVSDSASGGEPL